MTNYESYLIKEKSAVETLRKIIEGAETKISLVPKSTTYIMRDRIRKPKLDLKRLNKVIEVDTQKMEAQIEGCTTFYDIVKETLKHNLIPKIIPELKAITIGGTVSGLGLESSSFKYGIVQETLKDVTVLTGTGTVIRCSNTENTDMFSALPNSFGSLGYVLKCTANLIPAKKYVRLLLVNHYDAESYFAHLKEVISINSYDFIDGVVFGKNEFVTVLGTMTDSLPDGEDPLDVVGNIYYKILQNAERGKMVHMKILDYLFRWDYDAFWGMESYPILRQFLKNKFLRATVLRPLLRSYRLIKLKKFRDIIVAGFSKIASRKPIRYEELIQDFGIDINRSAEFIDWYDKEIAIYPLWVCPMKKMAKEGTYPLFDFKADVIIDLGFYARKRLDENMPDNYYLKKGEDKVREMGGMKGLYSKNTYSPEEFWQHYDKEAYFKIKSTYDPHSVFPNVYEKISRA